MKIRGRMSLPDAMSRAAEQCAIICATSILPTGARLQAEGSHPRDHLVDSLAQKDSSSQLCFDYDAKISTLAAIDYIRGSSRIQENWSDGALPTEFTGKISEMV
jgi:hypothetical protein